MCEHYSRHEEMVYLLGNANSTLNIAILFFMHVHTFFHLLLHVGRMGNQKRALRLIINELQDVDKVGSQTVLSIVGTCAPIFQLYDLHFFSTKKMIMVGGVSLNSLLVLSARFSLSFTTPRTPQI